MTIQTLESPSITEHDIEAVLLDNDPESLELLKQFYDGLLVAAFPDPKIRDKYESMVLSLNQNHGDIKNFPEGDHRYNVLLLRQGEHMIGGFAYDYLSGKSRLSERRHDIVFAEYSVVDKEHRQRGYSLLGIRYREEHAQALAQRNGRKLEAVLSEIEDPEKMTKEEIAKEIMDPYARREWAQHLGYRALDFDYVQPILLGRRETSRNLTLVIKPLVEQWTEEQRIPSADVAGMLDVRVQRDKRYSHRSSTFRQMRSDIMSRSYIQLKDLI